MSIAENLKPVAARLIAQEGQSMTLTRETSGGFDPATGTNSVTTATFTFNGVELSLTKSDDAFFEPGTLVNGVGRLILAEAIETAPQAGDSVTYGGQEISVVSVSRLGPSGVAVIYKIRGVV